jgi:hypothetical protein
MMNTWFWPGSHFGDTAAGAIFQLVHTQLPTLGEAHDLGAAFVSIFCLQWDFTVQNLVHENFSIVRQLLTCHSEPQADSSGQKVWALWSDCDPSVDSPTPIYNQQWLLVWSSSPVGRNSYFDGLRLHSTHPFHLPCCTEISHSLLVYTSSQDEPSAD